MLEFIWLLFTIIIAIVVTAATIALIASTITVIESKLAFSDLP